VFLWQKITYSFKTSSAYPTKLGLWRAVEGGVNEELLAPFDTSARFKFYVAGEDTSRTAAPALSDIRGLELVLSAVSPRGTSNDTTSSQSKLVTSVFFKNVRVY
jgi:hypothetical protein